jgi:hypothetical protein
LPPPRFSKALQPPSARAGKMAPSARMVAKGGLLGGIVGPSGYRFCPSIMESQMGRIRARVLVRRQENRSASAQLPPRSPNRRR